MNYYKEWTQESRLFKLLKSKNVFAIKTELNELKGKNISFEDTIYLLILAIKVNDENNEIFYTLFSSLMSINKRTVIELLNLRKYQIALNDYDLLKYFYFNTNSNPTDFFDIKDEDNKTVFELAFERIKIPVIKFLITFYFFNSVNDYNRETNITNLYLLYLKYLNLLLTYKVPAADIIYLNKLFIDNGIDINIQDTLNENFLQKVLKNDVYDYENKKLLITYALSQNCNVFCSNEKEENILLKAALNDKRFLDIFFMHPNVISQLLVEKLELYIYLYYYQKVASDSHFTIDALPASLSIPDIVKNVENTLNNNSLNEIVMNNPKIDIDFLLILSIFYKGTDGDNIIIKSFKENPDIFQKIKGNNNWYSLGCACQYGNDDLVIALLSIKANIDFKNYHNETPLIIACNYNQKSTIQLLLDNLKFSKDNINTSLILACRKKNHEFVKLLLRTGANPNTLDEKKKTPLVMACENNDLEMVKILLDANADPEKKDNDGNLPLILACHKVNLSIMEELLKKGANPNGFDDKKRTPLIWACLKKNIELVRFLLNYSVDINFRCFNGNTPLIISCFNHQLEIAKELLNRKDIQINLTNLRKNTPLITAAECGDIEIVKELLNRKASIDNQNKFGYTALMCSIEKDHNDIAKLLLDHHASITNKTRDGETPLFIACRRNNQELIELLVEHHADINGRNSNLKSVLMQACENKNMNLVQYLVQHQADINKPYGTWNETAFMAACKIDDMEIFKYLLNYNIDLNLTSWYNKNSLMYLCENGLYPQANLIIDQIKDINLRDRSNNTALSLACKNNHLQCMELLITHGAECHFQNSDGNNLLHLACLNGNSEIIKLLSKYDIFIDVNAQNKDGDTPLLIAAKQEDTEILINLVTLNPDINFSLCNNSGETIFEIILNQQNNQCIQKLKLLVEWDKKQRHLVSNIEKFFTMDSYDQKGLNTDLNHNLNIAKILFEYLSCDPNYQFSEDILFIFVKFDYLEAIQYIFEHCNCSINYVDPYSNLSYLFIATYNNSYPVVKYLLEKGANVNQLTYTKNETALMIASLNGFEKVLNCILQYTPDINEINSNGETALCISVKYNYTRCAESLLMHYADPNISDKKGNSPLYYACRNGNIKLVDSLLKFNANPAMPNNLGETPLMAASINGSDEIIKLLQKCQIDLDETNNNLDTALILSCKNKHYNVANTLLYFNADPTPLNKNGRNAYSYVAGIEKFDELFNSYRLQY